MVEFNPDSEVRGIVLVVVLDSLEGSRLRLLGVASNAPPGSRPHSKIQSDFGVEKKARSLGN
jgi:hypothetical protein